PAGIDQQEPHEDWAFNQKKAISVNKAANEYWFAQVVCSAGDGQIHVRWFDHSSKTVLFSGLERPMELFLSQRCGNIKRSHVKRIVEVQWLGPDESTPDHEQRYYIRFIRTLDNSFTWASPEDIQLDRSNRCKVCDSARDKQTRFNNSTNTITLQGLEIHRGDFLVTQPMSSSPWFPGVAIPRDDRNSYPGQIFQVVVAVRSDDPVRDTIVGLVLQPFERVYELQRRNFVPAEHDACPGRPAYDERRLCVMDPWNSLLEWDTLKEYPVRKCYVRHPDTFATPQDMNAWLSKSALHFIVDLQAVTDAEQVVAVGHRGPQDPLLRSVQPLPLGHFQGITKSCRKCPEEPVGTRVTRMRMLDLFSGAGGLTQGLALSGVCEPKYAIDHDAAALATYRQNFPSASTIHQDVNVALSKTLVAALAGRDRAPMPDDNDDAEPLPGRYDVDLIAAGPPWAFVFMSTPTCRVNPHLVIPETEASRAEDRRRRNGPEGRIPAYIAVKEDRQPIGIGAEKPAPYRADSPFTTYQQEARGDGNVVYEHYTSSFKSGLFVERVVTIPLSANADHRTLPPILKKGDFLSNIFGSGGASGYYQGAFGRYDKKSHFATILTSLRPAKKNGFCIHPEQKRMLTMREIARAQGFPDHFKFHGTVEQVNRQIGNAVVVQVARAIGSEIKKAMVKDGAP
ncbi:uroporphyrin-III C-methyltransferase, partial [Ceratobasidium sp. 423]